MKLLALIAWLLPACLLLGQTAPLPYVKNGKWCLADTTGKLLQETDYSYIHVYDAAGFTFFCRNGAYGILDRAGKVVIEPVYADVQQNGNGHYRLRSDKGWSRFTAQNLLAKSDTAVLFRQLADSWALTGRKDSSWIENLSSGNRWLLRDSNARYVVLHDHLVLRINDSTELLLDPAGQTIFSGEIRQSHENDLYHVWQNRQHYLFDAAGKWPYRNIREVCLEERTVFIRMENEGVLCGYDRSVILRGDYDQVQDFNQQYFYGTKNGLMTLIDRKTHQHAVPYRYEAISINDSLTYQVYKDGFSGLTDLQFRELIPCRYTHFELKGDLVHVFDERYRGLYSLKRRTELLPAIYNTISQSDLRFKAQRNELITILEIDERHNILKTAKIDNALTVRQAAVRSRRPKEIDPRLFALGWFLDSTLVQPSGAPPFYAVKWGLRGRSDTVLIRPSLSELRYVPAAPFTMQYTGKVPYVTTRGTISVPTFRPIHVPGGKILSAWSLLSYDSTDFRRRDFIRVSTDKGFGILRANGNYQAYAYLEKGANTYLRYCESETIFGIGKDDDLMTEVPSLNYRGTYIEHPIMRDYVGRDVRGLVYPEGKWNFLDPDGNPLFKDPFVFAHPFLGKQAIVKTAKGWGVVSPDTLLIPAIYSRIQRSIVGKDTFFVVQRNQPGNRLLDTLGTVVPGPEIVASTAEHCIVLQNGQKFLCDAQLRPISEGYSSIKFLKNGLILAKTKKEYTLFDPEGTLLYTGNEEPENAWFGNAIVFRRGAGLTLCNAALEPVAEGCTAIERQGPFITAKKGGEWFAWDEHMTPLFAEQGGELFADTIAAQLAVYNNDKTTVYAADGKRVARLKGIRPAHFIAGRLWVVAGDSCTTYSTDGQQRDVFHGYQSLEVQENGDLFLKIRPTAANKRAHNCLFTRDWQPILPEEAKFRQLTVLAPEIYRFGTASGKTALYNRATGRIDTTYKAGSGVFQNGRLLVRNNFGFLYVDTDFQPLTQVTFQQAIPFNGNFAAVADGRGWTLIDRDCRPLGYPNFGPVTALNPAFFQTAKLPLFGVFDTQGKELIPVVYEQVKFLPNGIILCIKEGAFTYFRKDGTPLLR